MGISPTTHGEMILTMITTIMQGGPDDAHILNSICEAEVLGNCKGEVQGIWKRRIKVNQAKHITKQERCLKMLREDS
jgi:hypothetical protein